MSEFDSASDSLSLSYHSYFENSMTVPSSGKRGHIVHGGAASKASRCAKSCGAHSAPSQINIVTVDQPVGQPVGQPVSPPAGPPTVPTALMPLMVLYGMQGSINNLATVLSHGMTSQKEPAVVASEMVSEVDKNLPMHIQVFLLKKFKEDATLATIYASTTDPELRQQFAMETYNEGAEGASGSGTVMVGPSTATNENDFNDIYK